jgi:hypothetical protein
MKDTNHGWRMADLLGGRYALARGWGPEDETMTTTKSQYNGKQEVNQITCNTPEEARKAIEDGNATAAIPYTGEGRCPDCNVATGGFHHPGCDMEKCPLCGGQIISCGCLD